MMEGKVSEPDSSAESQMVECLAKIGISSPVDWDVLVFVHGHQASLASAEQIARLLGYTGIAVANALANLEQLKLIRRSRASRGVRLYEFVPSDANDPLQGWFRQLITLADPREGRLLLVRKLKQRVAASSRAEKAEGNDENG